MTKAIYTITRETANIFIVTCDSNGSDGLPIISERCALSTCPDTLSNTQAQKIDAENGIVYEVARHIEMPTSVVWGAMCGLYIGCTTRRAEFRN